MIYLRTGLPGASKSLNSVRELVLTQDEERPFFYNNIKLLMLDMAVANSFSGWFYGWYFPRLKNAAQKRKLIKIMKPVHDNDEFITLADVPWLQVQFDSHNHFDTWLYWVRKVYPKDKLIKLENILDCVTDEDKHNIDMWEAVKPLNLHFTHFDDPSFWYDLPKKSVILIDECQEFFPPRAVGSRKPEAIARLEKHRHGGYDLHFITQDATLADQNLRKLVGRHIHFYNPFGGKRITRYESPQTFNPQDYHGRKQATKKFTAHATNFYGVYWSAEIHTHGFKFPKMLLVALFTVLMVILGIFFVVNMISNKKSAETYQNVESVNETVIHPSETPPRFSPEPVRDDFSDNVDSPPPNTVNPLSEVYTDDLEVSTAQLLMKNYLQSLTEDVYINGAMGRGDSFDYVFYRTTDDSVFHPLDVGLEVEPLNACFANIRLGALVRVVTCNPFYKRVPVDDESRFDESRFGDDDSFDSSLAKM
jgi:zona occludens toxin